MKRTLTYITATLSALLAGATVYADSDGPWQIRIRSTYLAMDDASGAFTALGVEFPSDAVRVDNKWIPEFDVSYSFTANIVAELVLTVPQTQDVTLGGVGRIGSFKQLPPVLAVQYHFLPKSTIDPYLGVGANSTLIYDSNLSVAGVPLELDTHSFGVAAEAGADISLGGGFFLNADVKKVTLSSGIYVAGGTKLTTARLDPWLISAGIGWRF